MLLTARRCASPTRPARVDPEERLPDDLVSERLGARVEAGGPDVAGEPFEPRAAAERATTHDFERGVDDRHRGGGRSPLGREDLHGPAGAVVDALDPVAGQPVEYRAGGVELEVHVRDLLLHEG